jgi:hypothetical protein
MSQQSNSLFQQQPAQTQAPLFTGFGTPHPQPDPTFAAPAQGFPQPAGQMTDGAAAGGGSFGAVSPFGSSGGFSMGASDPSKRKTATTTARRYRAKRK